MVAVLVVEFWCLFGFLFPGDFFGFRNQSTRDCVLRKLASGKLVLNEVKETSL